MTKLKNVEIDICPFLGLDDDLTSHMAFTSPDNICHQCKPKARINLEHQNDYCLDANFVNCPVYVGGGGKRMPSGLAYVGQPNLYSAPMDKRFLWAGIFLFGIILAGVLFLWLQNSYRTGNPSTNPVAVNVVQSSTSTLTVQPLDFTSTPRVATASASVPELGTVLPLSTATVSPFPTLTITVPTPRPTRSFTPRPIKTSSSTASITYTPSPTFTQISPHSLESPIGRDQQFLIHRIVAGENLTAIAEKYGTITEAIMAVNYALVTPIRVNVLVVIPLKNKDPQGLPVFEPYQLLQDQITVEALAEQLKADPALFKLYNDLADNEKLRVNDWFLVPRQEQKK